ncbi:hypothetical protein [Streptomyces sp. NPDC049040]|uniref:hypothetical protein n=1 Tax=Streptomyces sp. NPDC049040 TaxID=3365593 RepID=UPI0037233249
MDATVMVWAEAPPLGRTGSFNVVIDGVKAGQVRQGEVEPFTVEPGRHTVRVSGGGSRSNTVTVEVADGETARVAARATGLSTAAVFMPPLALIPGLICRLQVQSHRQAPAAPPTGTGTGAGANGLWWETDPVLSKRFKTAAPRGDAE